MLTVLASKLGIRTRRQFRLALRGALIFVGVASGYAVAVLVQLCLFWWSAIPFMVLLMASTVEFVLADYLAEQNYPIETEHKIEILERRLGARAVEAIEEKLRRIIATFQACDTSQVSGTVHIVVELTSTPETRAPYGLLQLTNYVGPYGGSKGRITPLEKGIIGKCARTAATETVNFSGADDYRVRMVREFGFSRKEAEMHTTIARSYIAQPLLLGSDIIGVLYFFSAEPQVFPHAARGSNLSSSAEDLVDLLKTVAIV
jgi:hypothetical protein